MKKKRLLCLSLLIILAIFLHWWFFPNPPRINRESYKLISNGMSRSEVEAIFRAPPGDHGSPKYNGKLWPDIWYGDRIAIKIFFSPEDKVEGTVIFAIGRPQERTWFQKIGDFLSSW